MSQAPDIASLDPWTYPVQIHWSGITHIAVNFSTALDFNIDILDSMVSGDAANGDFCAIDPDTGQPEGWSDPVPWRFAYYYLKHAGAKKWDPYRSPSCLLYNPRKGFILDQTPAVTGEPIGVEFQQEYEPWTRMALHPSTSGPPSRKFGLRFRPIPGPDVKDTRGKPFTGYKRGTDTTLEIKGWELGKNETDLSRPRSPACYVLGGGPGGSYPVRVAEALTPAGMSFDLYFEHGIVFQDGAVNAGGVTVRHKGQTFRAWAVRPFFGDLSVLCIRSDLYDQYA